MNNQPRNQRQLLGVVTEAHQRGKIKFFHYKRGYGFIIPDNGGPDVYIDYARAATFRKGEHNGDIVAGKGSSMKCAVKDDRVIFEFAGDHLRFWGFDENFERAVKWNPKARPAQPKTAPITMELSRHEMREAVQELVESAAEEADLLALAAQAGGRNRGRHPRPEVF